MRNGSWLNRKRQQRWRFNKIYSFFKIKQALLKDLGAVSATSQHFSRNNVVFTTSHKNFVLNYTVSVSIWMPPFFSRECYLLFHFFKKESCLGGVHRHLLFYESNGGQRQGSWERVSLRSSPMVAFVDGGNTNSKTGQSQRKLTCLILSLRGRQRLSFHLFPTGPDLWATLNKQNSV